MMKTNYLDEEVVDRRKRQLLLPMNNSFNHMTRNQHRSTETRKTGNVTPPMEHSNSSVSDYKEKDPYKSLLTPVPVSPRTETFQSWEEAP